MLGKICGERRTTGVVLGALFIVSLALACRSGSAIRQDAAVGVDAEFSDSATDHDSAGPQDALVESDLASDDADNHLSGMPCGVVPGTRTPLELPMTAGAATAYQIDVAHTGNQTVSRLRPPLVRRWTAALGDNPSYPLIVDGRVFLTVADPFTSGTRLFALSLATGDVLWGPIPVRGRYAWSTTTYEDKRVFVLSDDGYLAAHDAATGAVLWSNDLRTGFNYQMSSPPTAAGGTVFVTGSGIGGHVFAIAADTGTVRWTANVPSGDSSSPAVVPEAVITSSACEQVLAMAPDNGCVLWQYFGPCLGGGGGTPVIQGDRVWVIGPTFPLYETTNEVLDRRTGVGIRRFETLRSPALDGDFGYFAVGAKLEKVALDSGSVVWTFQGDDGLRAPILANGHAYVVSTTGMLNAVNLETGAAAWSDKVADWISSESDTTAPVRFGLAAGEDYLVVPGRSVVIAYQ